MVSFECCQFLSFFFFFFFAVGKKIHFVGISFKRCVGIVSISLFKYFEPVKDKAKGKRYDASSIALSLSNKDKNGVSKEKLITISEKLRDIDDNNKTAASSKRAVYKDLELLDMFVKMETLKLYQSLKVTSLNLMKA